MALKKTSPDLDHFFVFEARCLVNPHRDGMLEWRDTNGIYKFDKNNHAFALCKDYVTAKGYLDPADAVRNFNQNNYDRKRFFGNEVFVAVNENPDHSDKAEVIFYDKEAKRWLAVPTDYEDFIDFDIITDHQAQKLYRTLFGFVTEFMEDKKPYKKIADIWLVYGI